VDLGPLPEASYVSRHHAEFRFDGSTWFIRDMGSRNGTFWRSGGQGAFSRVAGEQQLASGDEIALGNARFEFKTV
jgi:pSer/pThr/pTyr-binding forkhead associated (FHA) protein